MFYEQGTLDTRNPHLLSSCGGQTIFPRPQVVPITIKKFALLVIWKPITMRWETEALLIGLPIALANPDTTLMYGK
jgi:hypothetical protein